MIGGRLFVLGVLLVGCQTSSATSLPAAPFDLRTTPASLTEGDTLVVSLAPKGDADLADVAPVDLYVSFLRDAGVAWGFLDPSGRWTAEQVRYGRIEAGPISPVVMRFTRVQPFGRYTFRVQFVRAGQPPSRKHYVFQPAVVTVRIHAAGGNGRGLVVSLALVTAGAMGLVAIFPRAPRPRVPSGAG